MPLERAGPARSGCGTPKQGSDFMWTDWSNHDPPDDDRSGSDAQWSPDLSFGDPDAWRGAGDSNDADVWRGEVHGDDWPEWNTGPEYRMWKRLADGRDE